jgi:stage IV sporulation protein FB
MFETGYLQIAKLRGAPVRIHWSVAIGVAMFTGLRFAPAAWLGFVLLVLAHELGHAAFVLLYRLEVVSVDVHGFGGVCRWHGVSTRWERAVIAWGGVLAQLAILVATYGLVFATGAPTSSFATEIVYVFTTTNLWLLLINLMPVSPLDGADAWTIVRAWRERRGSRQRMAGAREHLRRIETAEKREASLTADDEERLRKLFEDTTRPPR